MNRAGAPDDEVDEHDLTLHPAPAPAATRPREHVRRSQVDHVELIEFLEADSDALESEPDRAGADGDENVDRPAPRRPILCRHALISLTAEKVHDNWRRGGRPSDHAPPAHPASIAGHVRWPIRMPPRQTSDAPSPRLSRPSHPTPDTSAKPPHSRRHLRVCQETAAAAGPPPPVPASNSRPDLSAIASSGVFAIGLVQHPEHRQLLVLCCPSPGGWVQAAPAELRLAFGARFTYRARLRTRPGSRARRRAHPRVAPAARARDRPPTSGTPRTRPRATRLSDPTGRSKPGELYWRSS